MRPARRAGSPRPPRRRATGPRSRDAGEESRATPICAIPRRSIAAPSRWSGAEADLARFPARCGRWRCGSPMRRRCRDPRRSRLVARRRRAPDSGRSRAGAPILVDSEMVAAGIARDRLPAGNPVICTLRDPRSPALAAAHRTTRSAAAVELWRPHLDGRRGRDRQRADGALSSARNARRRARAQAGADARLSGRLCRRRRGQGGARRNSAAASPSSRCRPARRQRAGRRRGQRAGGRAPA